jgi:hypothetical protein
LTAVTSDHLEGVNGPREGASLIFLEWFTTAITTNGQITTFVICA